MPSLVIDGEAGEASARLDGLGAASRLGDPLARRLPRSAHSPGRWLRELPRLRRQLPDRGAEGCGDRPRGDLV